MTQAPGLPPWAALLVAVLLVAGALVALIGLIGLIRLRTFYDRVHAPTMGSSMGAGLIALASIICFSAAEGETVRARGSDRHLRHADHPGDLHAPREGRAIPRPLRGFGCAACPIGTGFVAVRRGVRERDRAAATLAGRIAGPAAESAAAARITGV